MKNSGEVEMTQLWVLKRSDGQRTLLDIAERWAMPFVAIGAAAGPLANAGLRRGHGEAESLRAQKQ
jgi:aminopeptidase-like protein